MNQSRILLSPPHMSGNEQKYLQDAFDTNWIAPMGANIDAFELKLEQYLNNNKKVIALNSGTSAIHLGLILLGVQPNDEVICQSFTFIASVNPVLYLGATPVFVDSEISTWNMCPVALENAIQERIKKGKKPKAIILVHLYGMPAQLDEIISIAHKYQIPILEDSAEALGSTYKNKPCGSFGEVAIFSFNGNKIITTSSGGSLIVNDENQKQKAVFLATQSKDIALHYEHSQIGYNYRMSNICAAIGCGQMDVLSERISQRRSINAFYVNYFSSIESVEIHKEPSSDYYSNHWLTCILFQSTTVRDAFYLHLLNNEIEARFLWKPMHLQPVFADNLYFGNQVSESLFEKGLCLPSGSSMNNEDLNRIKTVMDNFFENKSNF